MPSIEPKKAGSVATQIEVVVKGIVPGDVERRGEERQCLDDRMGR